MSEVNMRRGFTLLELLIVVAIIALLAGILLPALEKATERSRVAACGSNMHQLANALATYANDFNGWLPVGPGTASGLSPARTWDTIGSNQVWIAGTGYNGMGVLASGSWLSDPRVLVCPSDASGSLKNDIKHMLGGPADVYRSYAYRQRDQRSTNVLATPGLNGVNNAARAVALDWESDGPAPYGHHAHDSGEYANVLYCDGHVQYFHNDDRELGAKVGDYASMPTSYLHRLDQVWVTADWAESGGVEGGPKLP